MTIRSRVLATLTGVTFLLLSFVMPAAAAPATTAADSTVISMAEFQKLLAEPLSANPGCGTRCDYKSPYYYVYWCGMGCEDNWRCADDAITIREDASGPDLDYRYSPSCRTGWARGLNCYSGGNLTKVVGNYSYRTTDWNTGRRAATYGPAAPNTCYSKMLFVGAMWGVVSLEYVGSTVYSDWVYGY